MGGDTPHFQTLQKQALPEILSGILDLIILLMTKETFKSCWINNFLLNFQNFNFFRGWHCIFLGIQNGKRIFFGKKWHLDESFIYNY